MNEIEKTAERLARKAGEYARDKRCTIKVSSKGDDVRDLVTNIDVEISNFLRDEIKKTFPEHAFYSEEEPGVIDNNVCTWVVDPIDGTSNYARSIPYYSSCVTAIQNGKVLTSVVYSPVMNECFQLTNNGVFCNGEEVRVGSVTELKEAYTNFHPGRKEKYREWAGKVKTVLLGSAKKSVNLSSSALDLCYIASGRIDVLIYGTLTTIDIIGTIEMVRRAGGDVYNYDTKEPVGISTEPQRIIATSNKELLEDYFDKVTFK